MAKLAHFHKTLAQLDVERESAVRWHWQTTLMIGDLLLMRLFARECTSNECSHLGPTILIVF
jgi:hypothetical protein